MKRRLADRIWFTGPQRHWYGKRTLIPYYWAGDEYDWHVWSLGWTITGRVHLAIRPCPGTGKCLELGTDKYLPISVWPEYSQEFLDHKK